MENKQQGPACGCKIKARSAAPGKRANKNTDCLLVPFMPTHRPNSVL